MNRRAPVRGVAGCATGVSDDGPVELDAPSGSDDGDLGALPVLAVRSFSPDEVSVAE